MKKFFAAFLAACLAISSVSAAASKSNPSKTGTLKNKSDSFKRK